MTAEELVKKYNITIFSEDPPMLKMGNGAQAKKDKALTEIRAQKPKIMAYLREKDKEAKLEAERQAAKEYEKKLEAITGYKALCKAIDADKEFQAEYIRYKKQGLYLLPKRKTPSPDAVRKKHPMAAAFEKALEFSRDSNRAKAAIGEWAKNAILETPASYAEVIYQMEAEWAAHVEQVVWD